MKIGRRYAMARSIGRALFRAHSPKEVKLAMAMQSPDGRLPQATNNSGPLFEQDAAAETTHGTSAAEVKRE